MGPSRRTGSSTGAPQSGLQTARSPANRRMRNVTGACRPMVEHERQDAERIHRTTITPAREDLNVSANVTAGAPFSVPSFRVHVPGA